MSSDEPDPGASDPGPSTSTDLLAGAAMLALAAGFFVNTGEEFLDWIFPRILIYAAAVMGVGLAIKGLLGYGGRIALTPAVLRGKGRDVAVFVLFAVALVLLVEPVGFWITCWAMIFGTSVYLSPERGTRQVMKSALIALAVCVFSFLLFYRVFYIPFPRANWLPFL